eukprot:TRINITY_DN9166_c0_g1_i1.p1 TRINITY_DN9166_c0_g1~~TRINITY_DN9166_c0_g1_i1.p1  ORF type:complete len:210 (-),score=14.30 TRINITY_DN9166_c0_g1_i1:286-885(-)
MEMILAHHIKEQESCGRTGRGRHIGRSGLTPSPRPWIGCQLSPFLFSCFSSETGIMLTMNTILAPKVLLAGLLFVLCFGIMMATSSAASELPRDDEERREYDAGSQGDDVTAAALSDDDDNNFISASSENVDQVEPERTSFNRIYSSYDEVEGSSFKARGSGKTKSDRNCYAASTKVQCNQKTCCDWKSGGYCGVTAGC